MLQSYLYQWFSILGTRFRNQDLWYIDGFAGPGEYINYSLGSPIAALNAAASAVTSAAARWASGDIHCLFIEQSRPIFENLQRKLAEQTPHPRVHYESHHGTFVEGLEHLRSKSRNPFSSNAPVFAFIDPFGPSDLPFSAVRELLSRPACEVLVNLDSDGVSRIHSAGESADHRRLLTSLFGDSTWEQELAGARDQADAVRRIVQLYKTKLRALPGIQYAFSFEMRKQNHVFDYHLVFASGHPLGLEKMKEVMKRIDKTGAYCFSDAHVGQANLFSFDDPTEAAQVMATHVKNTVQAYKDITLYALNESPFPNPKSMLKVLEREGRISIDCAGRHRRKDTYPDDLHEFIRIRF